MTQHDRIVERSSGFCECCGQWPDFRGIQVHHLKPKGMGGTKREYPDDMLIALCGKCHSAMHHIKEA